MEWRTLAKKINCSKDNYEKSYKCINKNTSIKIETIKLHIKTLIFNYNNIVDDYNIHKHKLTEDHNKDCRKLLKTLGTKLRNISHKWEINVHVPDELELHAEVKESETENLDESKPIIDTLYDSEIETLDESPKQVIETNRMAESLVEFLKLSSSLLPEFDGRAENLRSFKDALLLIDTLKGSYEAQAIILIKTKLKGCARNLISNEATITAIIDTLTTKIKGESVDVISAKIMNLQQKNKTANHYAQEIEKLTKTLEGAFINDGLSSDLATKYSTTFAVKAMSQNCTIDKVKLIMQAGTFSDMNEVVSKFVNSCTDATGMSNTVLHCRQTKNYRGNYRRGNNHNNSYRNNNYNRGNGRYRGNPRGRNNSYRGHNNYNNNNNNNNRNDVRVTQSNSENSENPLGNNI